MYIKPSHSVKSLLGGAQSLIKLSLISACHDSCLVFPNTGLGRDGEKPLKVLNPRGSNSTEVSPKTMSISVIVVVIAALFFGAFLWVYITPLLRKPISPTGAQTQEKETQHAVLIRAVDRKMMTREERKYAVSSRSFQSSTNHLEVVDVERANSPYLASEFPVPPPLYIPTRHRRRQTPFWKVVRRTDRGLVKESSFKGLPPLPKLFPIVVVSKSHESLAKAEVLVSQTTTLQVR